MGTSAYHAYRQARILKFGVPKIKVELAKPLILLCFLKKYPLTELKYALTELKYALMKLKYALTELNMP